jgi:hypothetical protein
MFCGFEHVVSNPCDCIKLLISPFASCVEMTGELCFEASVNVTCHRKKQENLTQISGIYSSKRNKKKKCLQP